MDMSKKSAKEGMEMDHSKMEGMKMDGMQEEVVTDSAKKRIWKAK
jgi:hypothetical protein